MIAKDETRKGELVEFKVDFTAADMNVEIVEAVKSDKKSVDLTEAKLIVSGGRGVGSAEGFDVIRDMLMHWRRSWFFQSMCRRWLD